MANGGIRFFSLFEGVAIALEQLRANKVRAALTILGVAVGVFVVVVISAAIHGINASVARDFEKAGPTTFTLNRYPIVWVHPSARWLWLMADVMATPRRATTGLRVTTSEVGGVVTIRLTGIDSVVRSVELRAENLVVAQPVRPVRLVEGVMTVEWRARVRVAGDGWVAVVVPDGDVARRVEVVGVR